MTVFQRKVHELWRKILRSVIRFMNYSAKQSILLYIGISIITFILMFALNQVTEFRDDDLNLALVWKTNIPTRNFMDIIQSQIHQYFEWGGRMVAHVIARVLLWWQKPFSSIANAVIIAALSLICCCYGKKKSVFTLLLATIFIYFFNADFDGTCNWIAGSSNYVWTIFICLLFFLPYLQILEKGPLRKRGGIILSLLMLPGGIIAGWTNENTAPVIVLMIICTIIWNKRKNGCVPIWSVIGLIGMIIGTGFLLLAPGNSVRSEFIANEVNSSYSVVKTLIVRCYYMERAVFTYLFPVLIFGGGYLLHNMLISKDWT